MLNEIFKAFFFIFIAEMGDKTQILAMTFATKYKVQRVLLGVLIGSALNHGLAIAFGYYLSTVVPIKTIQLIAAVSFILFGFWTLKSGEDEEESEGKNKYGPVVTVALAFFIGELGDKTQLTAITLSTDAMYPALILVGTVLGMLATSGIGIFLGSKIGERIPEYAIKFVSSVIFLFFGVSKLLQNLPAAYVTPVNLIVFFIVLAAAYIALSIPIIRNVRNRKLTPLKEVASTLYLNTQRVKAAINSICLGTETCGSCQGRECIIGNAKENLSKAEATGEYLIKPKSGISSKTIIKPFERDMVREGLINSIQGCLSCGKRHDKNCVMNRTRESLELIYFGEILLFEGDLELYIGEVEKREKKLAEEIRSRRKTNQENL